MIAGGPRPRVLIVDDERLIALDVQQTLNALGFDAYAIASSAEEALARAAERAPDVVLMDIRIRGELDGIATAERLRARYDTALVYLTAHADPATLERAKGSEPHGYLLKPARVAELRGAIELALHKHAAERRLRSAHEAIAAEQARSRTLLARFAATVEYLTCGVVVTDPTGHILLVNRPALEVFELGARVEEVIGRPERALLEHAHERILDVDRHIDRTRELIRLGTPVRGDRVDLVDGRVLERDFAPVMEGGACAGHVWCYYDVTAREAQRARLIRDLHEDPVSGALSRRGLEALAADLLRERVPFALFFIDLDGFKLVNDTLGHEGGDRALRLVATRLRAALRETDLVARVAGDEFVVLAPTHGPGLAVVARKLRAATTLSIPAEDGPVLLTASIGWASCPEDGADLRSLLRRADEAMYADKARQRERVRKSA